MKTIFKVAMLIAIMVSFSCEHESPVDLNSEDLQVQTDNSKKGKKVTKSFSNDLEGDDSPSAGECGGQTFYGTMTHLGKITGFGVTICPEDGDDPLTFISNDIIFAANGDEVYTTSTTYFVILSDTEGTYTGGFDITGGTGRFEEATGYGTFENAVYDLTTGHFSHNAIGEITY